MSPTTLPPEMLDEKNSGVKKKKKKQPRGRNASIVNMVCEF